LPIQLFTEASPIVRHRIALYLERLHRTSFSGINVNLNDPNFGPPTGVQQGPPFIQMTLGLNF